MQAVTTMHDAIYQARALGVPYDDTLPSNPNDPPLDMIGGRLPWPRVARISVIQAGDAEAIKEIKSWAAGSYSLLAMDLVKVNSEIQAAANDGRLSGQGRLERCLAAGSKWFARVGQVLGQFEGHHAALLGLLDKACQPTALDPTNAAQAVSDVELRGLIRTMPSEAQRWARVFGLALNEPDSAILWAVLRGDPAASGLTRDQHEILAGRFGVSRNPKQVAQVWAAAMALDNVAYLALHGSKRVAAASQQSAELYKVIQAVEGSASQGKVIAKIDALIEALKTTKVVDVPEAEVVA